MKAIDFDSLHSRKAYSILRCSTANEVDLRKWLVSSGSTKVMASQWLEVSGLNQKNVSPDSFFLDNGPVTRSPMDLSSCEIGSSYFSFFCLNFDFQGPSHTFLSFFIVQHISLSLVHPFIHALLGTQWNTHIHKSLQSIHNCTRVRFSISIVHQLSSRDEKK